MRDLSWKIFVNTGNVDAYLLYKETTGYSEQVMYMENDDSDEGEVKLEGEEPSS